MTLPVPVPDESLLEYPLDHFSRHYRVFLAIERARRAGERFRILDVGGKAGLTERFFPADEVTVVDVLAGSDVVTVEPGAPLPFADGSFDIVVSFDVLEHVLPDHRAHWLSEVHRVASEAVYFTVPAGHGAVTQMEERAASFYEFVAGRHHPWLSEHEELGVPSTNFVAQELDRTGYRTWERHSSNPLVSWFDVLVSGFVRDQARDVVAEPGSLRELNREFLASDEREPGYRSVFASARSDLRWLEGLRLSSGDSFGVGIDTVMRDVHSVIVELRRRAEEARARAERAETDVARLLADLREATSAVAERDSVIDARVRELEATRQHCANLVEMRDSAAVERDRLGRELDRLNGMVIVRVARRLSRTVQEPQP